MSTQKNGSLHLISGNLVGVQFIVHLIVYSKYTILRAQSIRKLHQAYRLNRTIIYFFISYFWEPKSKVSLDTLIEF